MAQVARIRIGIESARELHIEVEDGKALVAAFEKAVADGDPLMTVEDIEKNRYTLVIRRVAFIEAEKPQDRSGVGFSG